jgi:hypothetical protein
MLGTHTFPNELQNCYTRMVKYLRSPDLPVYQGLLQNRACLTRGDATAEAQRALVVPDASAVVLRFSQEKHGTFAICQDFQYRGTSLSTVKSDPDSESSVPYLFPEDANFTGEFLA